MHYCQFHGLRQLNAYRLVVVELDLDLQIRRQILHRIAESVALQMCLLVALGGHEIVVIAVAIEELHVNFIDYDPVDRIGRAKTVLEHGPGAQVA